MKGSRISAQHELDDILDAKCFLPSSFDLAGGRELSIRSEHIPRLLHKDLKKLRIGDHQFQCDAQDTLLRALYEHGKLNAVIFYNRLLPISFGRMLMTSKVANVLTTLTFWKIKFKESCFSSLCRSLTINKALRNLEVGYLTLPKSGNYRH